MIDIMTMKDLDAFTLKAARDVIAVCDQGECDCKHSPEDCSLYQDAKALISSMTDIVERLRNPSGDIFPMCRKAADTIERLRSALQDIAGNKTNSRAWLEDKARRALEHKP